MKRLASFTNSKTFAVVLLVAIAAFGTWRASGGDTRYAYAADPTAVESCPQGQDAGGVWMGTFRSSRGGALDGGDVSLIIVMDMHADGRLKRQFSFEATASNGAMAAGRGVIAASGETHIMGEGPRLMVKAHGDVSGCPEAAVGDFMYSARFADGSMDEGMVQLTHCPADGTFPPPCEPGGGD